jgi:hypothetical protein
VNGKVVNYDTDAYLERVLLLAESGKLWELRGRGVADRPRILEIGSGYGGLAYHLKKLIPQARYFLVDIPESLLLSSLYLHTLFAGADNAVVTPDNLGDLGKQSAGFTFLPNYLFDHCLAAGQPFDLVINTLSMSEMSAKQVRYYGSGIARLLGCRGVFFEQNRDTRFRGLLDARLIIRECLPYHVPLTCPFRGLTQGRAHLWAAAPMPPYLWRPSEEVRDVTPVDTPGKDMAAVRPSRMMGRLRPLGRKVLRSLHLR